MLQNLFSKKKKFLKFLINKFQNLFFKKGSRRLCEEIRSAGTSSYEAMEGPLATEEPVLGGPGFWSWLASGPFAAKSVCARLQKVSSTSGLEAKPHACKSDGGPGQTCKG